jgi:predicted RNase H-like nuclease (RuvC/YqgF family)
MFVLFTTLSKRGKADVIRTGSNQKLTEPGAPEQQVKDMKRMLAKAEQKIRNLEEKVADQKQQLREFQAQAKHEDNLAAEREDLKSEITDLKGEIRELTRANREQVEKIEALRAENAKLKAGTKVRKPSGMTAGADLRGLLQPSLS